MVALKLTWVWIKKNWKILFAIFGTFVGIVILRKANIPNLSNLIQQINDDHKKDVEILRKKDEEIAVGKEKIKEEERHKLEELNKKYDDLQKDLDEEQKRRAEEILRDSNADPDELAEQLAKVIGSKKLDY